MHSPKVRPTAFKEEVDESFCNILRWCLIIWAFLRLIVSGLWTGTIIFASIGVFKHQYLEITEQKFYDHDRNRLWIFLYASLVQLLEIGMIITFITAGVMKSAKLYRAYYYYCILTLTIFILGVALCVPLDYFGYAHHYIEVYLTYHIDELPIISEFYYFYAAFVFIAIVDVGLEILLIISIKKLIQRYSFTATSPFALSAPFANSARFAPSAPIAPGPAEDV